jgi:hypothetical protein
VLEKQRGVSADLQEAGKAAESYETLKLHWL